MFLWKNGKVIDFLRPPIDFPVIKMFKLKMLPNFKKRVLATVDDVTVTF